MKAIFMTEVGGKLLEVERREIEPNPIYYVAVREPITAKAMGDEDSFRMAMPKREKWVAHSMPNHPDGFAVFLFDSVQ